MMTLFKVFPRSAALQLHVVIMEPVGQTNKPSMKTGSAPYLTIRSY